MPDSSGARAFTLDGTPTIRGEVEGEGAPVILCHGLTATRGSVVHGSRTLARTGHRLVTYDARGHGESDPALEGAGYGYPELIDDLEQVVVEMVGDGRFFLGGHSMGAHTAVGYALRQPERLAGLVVIGPTYEGLLSAESLAYWDDLAAALETGGIDAFLDYIDRHQPTGSTWRDSVRRFTRERMLRHRHLGAVVAALRGVPRSRPFGGLEDLHRVEVPTLVVASHDDADPGHPYASAVVYADHLPQAELISEQRGQSPLAWQGGRLSRAIAAFAAKPVVVERL